MVYHKNGCCLMDFIEISKKYTVTSLLRRWTSVYHHDMNCFWWRELYLIIVEPLLGQGREMGFEWMQNTNTIDNCFILNGINTQTFSGMNFKGCSAAVIMKNLREFWGYRIFMVRVHISSWKLHDNLACMRWKPPYYGNCGNIFSNRLGREMYREMYDLTVLLGECVDLSFCIFIWR